MSANSISITKKVGTWLTAPKNHTVVRNIILTASIAPNCFIKTNGNTKHHVSWNKGLTKETDDRVKQQGEKYSQRVKEGIIKPWSSGLTKETDERVRNIAKKSSESISNKVKLDTWHNSFGKSKLVEYNGILFHGNWEVEFAKFLDKHIISWVRPTEKFNYTFENAGYDLVFNDIFISNTIVIRSFRISS